MDDIFHGELDDIYDHFLSINKRYEELWTPIFLLDYEWLWGNVLFDQVSVERQPVNWDPGRTGQAK